MPIRTNRGRAAVYRRLWGWPLRSPRHLVASGLFVVAIVLFLGYVLPKVTGTAGQTDGTAASASRSPSATARTSPRPSAGEPGVVPAPAPRPSETRITPPDTRTSSASDPKALDLALKWAQAWVNHPDGVSNEQWLSGLRPFTTEEYLPTMSTVDPARVPGKRVTGAPKTKNSYTSSATVEVQTDGPMLQIDVIKTPAGWRVAGYTEVG